MQTDCVRSMSREIRLPDTSKGFVARLRRTAESIKEEAAGRTCSTCKYFVRGDCAYPWDWKGATLTVTVYTPDAVACKRWEKREDAREG